MLLLFVQRLFCTIFQMSTSKIYVFLAQIHQASQELCAYSEENMHIHPTLCIHQQTRMPLLYHELPRAFKGSGSFASSSQGFHRNLPDSHSVAFNLPSILSNRAVCPESEGDPRLDPFFSTSPAPLGLVKVLFMRFHSEKSGFQNPLEILKCRK